jgi:predicted esterase
MLAILMSGCTSIDRYAHMHSDLAPTPNTHQFKDGGSSIYYDFTVIKGGAENTYLFFYGGSGCPSWKSVMPYYIDGLTVSARVFVLNKRFVPDRSTGMFGCGDEFHKANNVNQWVSDYAEFISAKLESAKSPPKNVVLVGVSEGAIPAIKVAAENSEVTHVAIIGDGGYTMRKALETLHQNGAISFNPSEGWERIKSNPDSTEDSWYGNTYRWWSEIMDYDPMPDYKKLDIPILVGIGENDQSVPVESAYYLESEFNKAGKTNLELRIYKGADHRLSAEGKTHRNDFFSILSEKLKH